MIGWSGSVMALQQNGINGARECEGKEVWSCLLDAVSAILWNVVKITGSDVNGHVGLKTDGFY